MSFLFLALLAMHLSEVLNDKLSSTPLIGRRMNKAKCLRMSQIDALIFRAGLWPIYGSERPRIPVTSGGVKPVSHARRSNLND